MFGPLFDPVVVAPPVAPPKEEEEIDMSVLDELDEPRICEVRHYEVLLLFGVEVVVGQDPKCERPAEWILMCKGCGDSFVSCDEHLGWALRLSPCACAKCSRVGLGSDVYQFAPLVP
jgi:hypothetical protein